MRLYDRPGGAIGIIPAHIYGDNQLNEEDTILIRAVVGVGVGAHMSDETVYTMIKLFGENVDGASEGTPWLRAISLDSTFEEMNLPLHPGVAVLRRNRSGNS